MPFKQGDRILFQGDSVTDCDRDRNDSYSLGSGYPALIAAYLWSHFPCLKLTILNRGVSGDRVYDLATRWEDDCIKLQPDWVSILIGINDTWRRFDSSIISPIEEFEKTYRKLLDQVVENTQARLVLCEPFVLDFPPDRRAWRPDLNPRIEVVRQLAAEYSAILVPLDGLFAAACTKAEPAFWADDGVHPTLAGHGLIAKAWLEAVSSRGVVSCPLI
ncbi:MAG: SGNH/GDSL hydrolase family protein [Firmicutes bacterium]|jgi:lysophospholipase L1-like esterase|nr:SGNH/GDSL hydrolase family protein [Bacillota bacterium]